MVTIIYLIIGIDKTIPVMDAENVQVQTLAPKPLNPGSLINAYKRNRMERRPGIARLDDSRYRADEGPLGFESDELIYIKNPTMKAPINPCDYEIIPADPSFLTVRTTLRLR